LKLKRVELQGFKSFADKTVLEFDSGITAILGPNGCGKSNIVDAIRWVLGEQSAKQLRGATMEDIIFKGTSKRKPVGLCEVGLTFSNEDRGLPIDFDEVTIKRRVTRDGNSQYYLNNSPVRLKDLRDLFFNSGINNTAYSVIEQEKIGRVLSENTQEVRLLIEEGAGIVKYKVRRKEAQRKLDRTEQDLLRLRDLVEEIAKEVRSLQRQVGKARRYQKLYKEIRSLDLMIAGKGLQGMDDRERELKEGVSSLSVLAEADSGELAELRSRVEATRPAVDEREAEKRGLEESLRSFENEMKEAEQKVLLSEHRIADHQKRHNENTEAVAETCRRRETVMGEIHELEDRRRDIIARTEEMTVDLLRREEELQLLEARFGADREALEKAAQMNMQFIESDNRTQTELRELQVRLENRNERLKALAEEAQRLEQKIGDDDRELTRCAALREELTKVRRELLSALVEIEKEMQAAMDKRKLTGDEIALRQARRESLSSRHELLKRIKDSWHGFSVAAQQILQRQSEDPGILGSLADSLHVDERWNAAIEMLFGEMLGSVVVAGTDKAVELIDVARQAEQGHVNILLTDFEAGAMPVDQQPIGGINALSIVKGSGTANPHIKNVLRNTWLFDSEEQAMDAAASYKGQGVLNCLSAGGLLVTSDGIVRGGRGKAQEVSLLGRGDKLEELEAEIAGLETEIRTMSDGLAANEDVIGSLKERVQQGRDDLEKLNKDLSQAHVEEAEAQMRINTGRERVEAIGRDRGGIEESLADLQSRNNALSQTLDETGRQRNSSTTHMDELRATVVAGEQERDTIRRTLNEDKLEHSRYQSEKRELDAAVTHREQTIAELTAAEQRLQQDIDSGNTELIDLKREVVESRTQLEAGVTELERRRRLVNASTEAISTLHEETAVWYDRIKEIEDKRTSSREEIHKLETELATMDVRRSNLIERIEEQYKGRFRELVRSVDPETLPRELEMDEGVFQTEQAQTLLEDARRKISTLGAVNHLAVEEFEQKSERLNFLQEQLQDVEKAKNDLTSTIQKINTTARKLFQETYEEVRRNYIAVFQTLFEGGRADLELIRTDDPLEANIRIIAQPKGKRVDSIRLLSGGERCLTALSLLFAVYLVKPSPFCLLDEADAPLDDANVERFVAMLKEFATGTQFLVVTHNKLTMETANHLYGVTMMEQGVSNLVSISFSDVASFESDEQLGEAIATRRRNIDTHEEEHAVLAEELPIMLADEGESRFMLGGPEPGDETEDASEQTDTMEEHGETEEPVERAMEAE
jgi:chromosome segregation protein